MTFDQLAAWLHSIIDEQAFAGGFLETYNANEDWTLIEGQINFKALALAIAEKCPFEVRVK
jgi:hypothetical protein